MSRTEDVDAPVGIRRGDQRPTERSEELHHLVVGLGGSGERSAHDRLGVGLVRGGVHVVAHRTDGTDPCGDESVSTFEGCSGAAGRTLNSSVSSAHPPRVPASRSAGRARGRDRIPGPFRRGPLRRINVSTVSPSGKRWRERVVNHREHQPSPSLRRSSPTAVGLGAFREGLICPQACHAYRSPEASHDREPHIGRTRARA